MDPLGVGHTLASPLVCSSFQRIKRRSSALLPVLLWALALLLGSETVSFCASPYAAWEATLTAPAIHPFPKIEPFEATYQFGWEGLRAGSAAVRLNKGEHGSRTITATGGPNRLIRKLWEYQANYFGEAGPNGEVPSWFHMDEKISKGDLLSVARFDQDSVFACHRLLSESKHWEQAALPGVRDLFAAMLFVRSQPLMDGDRLRLSVFPDQGPYLVDLKVMGRDMVTIMGSQVKAIRFSVSIQSIQTHGHKMGSLEPHKKFRSGRVWMSDDERRIPLRAEVDVFIGAVFGEITKLTPPFARQ